MYRVTFPVAETSLAFAGHGLPLAEGRKELLLLRKIYTRANNICCQTEEALGAALEEVLAGDSWKHSSAVYQMLKLGMDTMWVSALEDELGVLLPDIVSYAWGLSLGEPEALVVAEVWELPDGLKLLKKRGECIEAHQPPKGQWGTHALIGVAREAVAQMIKTLKGCGTTLSITGHNGEVIVVVGGHNDELVELARELRRDNGKMRVNTELGLGNTFHHPTLEAAAQAFEKAVKESKPRILALKVLSNVTGRPHEKTATLPHLLGRHLVQPVELVESINYLLSQGIKRVIIIGLPGPLKTLIERRFGKENIWTINSIESLLEVKRKLLMSCP